MNPLRLLRSFALLLFCLSVSLSAQAPKETKPSQVEPPAPAASAMAAHPMTTDDVQGFFDAAVPMQLERENIAGAVVAVVKDGKVIFEKGYGYADTKTKRRVSPTDTLFRPGSVSKLFTWTAVMQLVEQGKLDLDKDVNQYLDFQIPQTYPQPITLRHLLTHTPGFAETDKDLFSDKPETLFTTEQFLKTHLPPRIFAPGTTPAYSNYGAGLAGYIVQRVSGQSFDDYVDQHILQPLQMKHASFRQPLPAGLVPLMSSGYKKSSGDAKGYEFVNVPPAGSLAASADDMTHFMIAHLQDGRYGDAQLLKPETAAQMHARQTQTWQNPELNGMCLGFYEETRNGHRIIGHGGDTQWFHSDLHLIPDQGVGFFVSYNSAGNGDISPRGPLFRAFLDRYYPYPLPEIQPPASAASDNQAVLGSYETTRRCDTCLLRMLSLLSQTTFRAGKDGTIVADDLKSANGEPREWKEIAPLVYRDVRDQAKIAFTRMPDGEMRMSPGVNIVLDQRVPWYRSSKFTVFVMVGSCVVLLLVLVLWPIGALVRRHYDRPLPPGELGALRIAVRLVCALDLFVVLCWLVMVAQVTENFTLLSGQHDGMVHVVQFLQLLGVIGTLLALVAMLRAWFRQGLWWGGRLYYTVVALACLGFAWITFVAHMLDWSLRY